MRSHKLSQAVNALCQIRNHAVHRQFDNLLPANPDRRRGNTKPKRTVQQAQATTTVSQATDSKTEQQTNQLPAFDWRNQWYPVHFARDLPEGKPQRVYIFDEPIVLLKRPGEQVVVALRDRCPHRAAALSQGRMTPDGQLQCECYISCAAHVPFMCLAYARHVVQVRTTGGVLTANQAFVPTYLRLGTHK